MKMRIVLSTLILSLTTAVSFAQHEGIASDRDGVVFYIESMPANQYRHLGTVECSAFSPDAIDPLLDHVIKNARKDHEAFDALLFRPGKGLCKADVIQFYRDPKEKRKRGGSRNQTPEVKAEYKQSKAQPRKGTVVYIKNNPTTPYDLLGKVETPVTFRSKNIENLIDEIVRISKETYPNLDAVVIMEGTGLRKASVIKYK